jgi:MtaA/CmuA family methyltransferase
MSEETLKRIGHAGLMSGRRRFMSALSGGRTDRISVATPTSFVTVELQELTEACFPEAHLDPDAMVRLCAGAVEVFGYDAVCPTFAVANEAEALGSRIDWGDKENLPTVLNQDVGEPSEIVIPKNYLEKPALRCVIDAIRLARKEFGDRVAIIGKSLGAWTLLYLLHGVEQSLVDSVVEPDKVRRFIDVLKHVTIIYAKAQIRAGADCVMVGDHAPRDLTSPEFYRDFLLPYHREIVEEIGAPIIHHCCGDTVDRLHYYVEAGFDCFHLDSAVNAAEAKRIVGNRMSIVGNIDNPETLLLGTPEDVRREARLACKAGIDIVGPECAIPLRVPNANMAAITEAVVAYCSSSLSMN